MDEPLVVDDKPLDSVREVMANLVAYLPTLFEGFIVLVLGVLVAWIVSKLLVRLLLFLRLDRVITRLGWGRALEKGDVRHSLFGLVGMVVGILIFLIFLENAVVIWKMAVLSQFLEKLVLLIPQLITAVIILLIGWGAATTVSRSVQRALYQEEFERARLVARIVHAAIIVVACAIALVELNIAVTIVTGAFLIAFGALGLSFVFAIGLGSKRAVEMMWEERFRRQKEEREKAAETSKEK
jgi:Mechanosensitive ion channel, conserved TM helix